MKLLDVFFNSLYIYLQAKDEDGSGAKAVAYVLGLPGGLYATAGVIWLTHWLTPGILTEHNIIKIACIQLVCTLWLQRLVKECTFRVVGPCPRCPPTNCCASGSTS